MSIEELAISPIIPNYDTFLIGCVENRRFEVDHYHRGIHWLTVVPTVNCP